MSKVEVYVEADRLGLQMVLWIIMCGFEVGVQEHL